jgi:IS605 OrfB family transposase
VCELREEEKLAKKKDIEYMAGIRKIQIVFDESHPKNEGQEFSGVMKDLRNYRYASWRLANKCISEYYIILQKALKEASEEKTAQKWNRLVQEESGGECKTFSNFGYWLSCEPSNYLPDDVDFALPSGVRGPITGMARKKIVSDFKAIIRGQKTIPNYRLEKMNIPFQSAGSKIEKSDKDYHFRPSIKGAPYFKLLINKDNNLKVTVDRILSDEYHFGDSYLKIEGKKLYLYLQVGIPKKKSVGDPNICVGVDLGISVPAVCATNVDRRTKFIGDGTYTTKKRVAFLHKRKRLARGLSASSSGCGRNHKLRPSDRVKKSESQFFTNLNHNISKEIIKFAKRVNAGVIKLEFLEGFSAEHSDNMVLKNWTYHQLYSMVEYKAKREGIDVVRIDPYHTSQTCHVCGQYHPENRKGRVFHCHNEDCSVYGKKLNADSNAAKNIAMSDKIVTKKADCEFYRKAAVA